MKYKITDIEMSRHGHILHRIESLKDFTLINGKEIHKGDLGGWVENENNLSQEGSCWIYDECMMYEDAIRSENSIGYGDSRQHGNSRQSGNSQQFGDSRQFEYSLQSENSKQYGNSLQYGNSQQFGYSHQFEYSIQYGNSQQFGYSHQYGNSQQFGYSQQFGHSRQSGNSKQFENSKADKAMHLSGNSLFKTKDDIVILTSPTSGRQITIGSDRNICTGCFDGSSWFMIDEKRCQLPKDHWAFSLHRQLLEGKFKDIKLIDSMKGIKKLLSYGLYKKIRELGCPGIGRSER